MAKKEKKIEIKMGLAEWMGTYGDMVTLLMCFFVLMFATAETDVAKFEQMASSFKNDLLKPEQASAMLDAMGNGVVQMPEAEGDSDQEYESPGEGEGDRNLREIAENLKTYFAENQYQDQQIEVEENDNYITISFADGILFDSGSATLKQDAFTALTIIGTELAQYPNNEVKIEGHTDNIPINTIQFPNNWYLSAARAISVASFFIDSSILSPGVISTEGYGEYRPKASNDTPENRSINRRVEIKIMHEDLSIIDTSFRVDDRI